LRVATQPGIKKGGQRSTKSSGNNHEQDLLPWSLLTFWLWESGSVVARPLKRRRTGEGFRQREVGRRLLKLGGSGKLYSALVRRSRISANVNNGEKNSLKRGGRRGHKAFEPGAWEESQGGVAESARLKLEPGRSESKKRRDEGTALEVIDKDPILSPVSELTWMSGKLAQQGRLRIDIARCSQITRRGRDAILLREAPSTETQFVNKSSLTSSTSCRKGKK